MIASVFASIFFVLFGVSIAMKFKMRPHGNVETVWSLSEVVFLIAYIAIFDYWLHVVH